MTDAWVALAAVSFAAAAVLLWDRLRRRRDEAQAYLKGVRSVISGDPDAAIEALSDAARLGSPEAVETYLALGQLFRRTGDLSRAVRLHRNMLLGPALDPARRAEVERELAEDYRRSGMLAEAVEIYRKLGPADRTAWEGLRDVLVDAGDLPGAISAQRALAIEGADPVLAHLLAAAAREAFARAPAEATALAAEALRADGESADAHLAAAELAGAAGDGAAALDHVGRALDAAPRAALLAWPALAAVPDAASAASFVEARLAARGGDPALHLLHGRALHRLGRVADALAALRRALERDRRGEVTWEMRELLRQADAPGPGELAARHDLLVAALLRRGRAPRCTRCAADAPVRSWRCRRCGAFDAYA
ncbi:tetratricopeptide repeat protein [Anaeromyxobacter soli]|uniref:tetratricopeptide repeat protein n=1 Tax=Anaeromyxobacter soli TaxID=2922725 RepID=UPI001FB01443|nr:tetratricopeptide repeat protein [Anaeromyxobacter sp. SG29]